MAILIFLTVAVVSIADPPSFVGYLAIGLLSKRLIYALVGAAGWAIAMDLFVMALNDSYAGHIILQRIVGGLLVTSALYGIAHYVRHRRAENRD